MAQMTTKKVGVKFLKAVENPVSMTTAISDDSPNHVERGDKIKVEYRTAASGYEQTKTVEGRILNTNVGSTLSIKSDSSYLGIEFVRSDGRKVRVVERYNEGPNSLEVQMGDTQRKTGEITIEDETGVWLLVNEYEQVEAEEETPEDDESTDPEDTRSAAEKQFGIGEVYSNGEHDLEITQVDGAIVTFQNSAGEETAHYHNLQIWLSESGMEKVETDGRSADEPVSVTEAPTSEQAQKRLETANRVATERDNTPIPDGGVSDSKETTDNFRKWGPKPHPDWFWLSSGGIDSVAAFLLSRDALHQNFQKRPIMVYLDTRVGLPFNRLYVEELADTYNEQLWSLRTHEKFEQRVAGSGKYADREDSGPPGAALHSDVQNELKGRQRRKLAYLCDDKPIFVTGIRAGESDARAATPKGEEVESSQYIKPVYELSKVECARIILQHEECPINPGWLWNHFTDCGCMSNGDPSELDKVEERFPAFGQRLREYEEAIQADGLRGILGWDGLNSAFKSARENQQEQMTLCGTDCQRRTADTAVVKAFRARIEGATASQAIEVLDSQSKPTVYNLAGTP